MPMSGQIIPIYNHAHTETYINDNTTYVAETQVIDAGIKSLHVFTSDKGRDNQILFFQSLKSFYDEYGYPNYKLHGQASLMPYAALSSQYGNVYCMRVMPDDATYSTILYAYIIKPDKKDVPTSYELQPAMIEIPSVSSTDELESQINAFLATADGADNIFPIIAFRSQGRGLYGDNYRVRMPADTRSNKENPYFNYILEVYKKEKTLEKLETVSRLSLYDDAYYLNSSLFVDDVVPDESKCINTFVLTDYIEKLLNIINNVKDADELDIEAYDFDIINFKYKDGSKPKHVTIATTPIDLSPTPGSGDPKTYPIASLLDIEGLALTNGGDGNISEYVVDTGSSSPTKGQLIKNANRQDNINKLFVDAFSGDIDKSILSKRRVPLELIMDANYASTGSHDVKAALRALILKRGDSYGIMDAGIALNSQNDLLTWAETDVKNQNRLYCKEGQHYTIRDPFSGKKTLVTMTYFLAGILPSHYQNNGRQYPCTGERYSLLTGHIKNSLKPMIDADDLETKEKLYNAKVNYFEAIGEDRFIRGSQSTSQSLSSDLSEENNMVILLQMKREIEELVATLRYKFSEPEDRKEFTEAADRLLSKYRGTSCRTASVYFDMSAYEEQRNILHCYLNVVFKALVKTGIIEIDINPRA